PGPAVTGRGAAAGTRARGGRGDRAALAAGPDLDVSRIRGHSHMTKPLHDQRVVVTGGAGFLGSFVVEQLRARGVRDIFVPRSREYDLVDIAGVRKLYDDTKPDLVIHLAAQVGGIGANRKNPGKYFYDNLMMGVQLIEEGRRRGLGKIVAAGTICAYPKFAPVPFH